MYISNRKHAYRVEKANKTNSNVRLTNRFGAVFVTTREKIDANGYRFTSRKPAIF